LAEKLVKTIEHEGLYFEYWITFILYVLANKSFHFESDIIYGTPSAIQRQWMVARDKGEQSIWAFMCVCVWLNP
jgi:hypothetical protein